MERLQYITTIMRSSPYMWANISLTNLTVVIIISSSSGKSRSSSSSSGSSLKSSISSSSSCCYPNLTVVHSEAMKLQRSNTSICK